MTIVDSLDVDKSLELYRGLLIEANKKLNLVSRPVVDKRLPVLIEESLAPLSWEQVRFESPLLDAGSGGGLPGLPLKISQPDLRVTLLDSNRRKTLFLRRVIEALGLTEVDVVWMRLENYAALPSNQTRFRTITARGFGQLELLINSAVALLQEGGRLLVWRRKGDSQLPISTALAPPVFYNVSPGLVIVCWEKPSS